MNEREVAEQFIGALHQLEESREVEAIVGTFADDCEVGNVNAPNRFHGRDGARQFWTEYRATFGEMRSEFSSVIASDGRVALEWATTGTSADDKPVRYEGVSILEVQGERVARFRAYFDPGKLGRQMEG